MAMRQRAASDGDPAWRMPPMDVTMPMLPGLAGATPPAEPFVPGRGMDLQDFPEASPRQVLELHDGDEIAMNATIVRRRIRNREYLMYGYNGQYPGPLLKAPTGSTVVVNFRNQIDLPTTVHWHGLRLDNRFDGVPGVTQAPILPGESFRYEVYFADSGVYWYHPHVREDIQQDLGLYGNLLAVSPEPDYYGPANREEFLMLDDILMDEQGLLPWGADTPVHALMGRFGNVMLVNGATDYRLQVRCGEVVRFYLTNVANSRTFNVTFGGVHAKIVASDVGKFEHEQWVQNVPIAPAERYVVDVRFERPGVFEIENTIQAINHFRGEFYPHVDHLGTVEVSEERVSDDLGVAFSTLRSNPDVSRDIDRYRGQFDRPPDHELELSLEAHDLPTPIVLTLEFERGLYSPPLEWNDAMPMMNWLSSGKQVRWILRDRDTGKENMDIHWRFRVGDVVKIRIFNNPETLHPMHHPIHLHGQRFLVLERDGVRNDNLVWKDTTIVPVASTVDLLVDMSNPGVWMMHCHIAEHLHAGMMTSFTVTVLNGLAQPRVIAYFISPHGFGHAARAAAVIEALRQRRPGLGVEIFTTVPAWFLQQSLGDGFRQHPVVTDVGLVQTNALQEDVAQTLAQLDRLLPPDPAIAEQLAHRVREYGCCVLLADIAPLGLAVGELAGVPTVLVENFTWDWIYRAYLPACPGLGQHIETIRKLDRAATVHIQAEPVCQSVAGAVQVSLIARTARRGRTETRSRLGVQEPEPLILVTMGGGPWCFGPLGALGKLPMRFLVLSNSRPEGSVPFNVHVLPSRWGMYHPDLVGASDVVVGKLGYSTLAEAVATGAPYLYVERPAFPETEVLSAYADAAVPTARVSGAEFRAGSWVRHLPALVAAGRTERRRADGASEVADTVCALMPR